MSMSDSVAYATYVPAPPSYARTPSPSPQYSNITYPTQQVQFRQQPYQQFLDTQPEFTQSWADFTYPPGYLPQAFKNFQYVPSGAQTPNKQPYGPPNQPHLNPQSLGFGYITWSGPIDPRTFYVQYQLPYYYKFPPMSPFFSPSPYVGQQKYSVPIPALTKSVTVANVVRYAPQPTQYKGN
jgi:hypothetical protein